MDQTRENYEQQGVKTDTSYKEWERKARRLQRNFFTGRANTLALKTSELYYLPMSKPIVVCSIIS